MARLSRSVAGAVACGAGLMLTARVAFVSAPAPGLVEGQQGQHLRAASTAYTAPASSADTGAAAGSIGLVAAWAAAGAAVSVRLRTARRAEGQSQAPAEEPKKPFAITDPSTYGNIAMDDVKKYGAAGTVAYFLTELIFWAMALPTECFIYLQTAGHWPDFSNSVDSATVLGFVFAASNIARLLVPVRFGVALALAPWVDENIMSKLPGRSEA